MARQRSEGRSPTQPHDPLGATPGFLGIGRRPTRREWRRTIIGAVLLLGVLAFFIFFVHPSAHLLDTGTAAPAVSLPDAEGRVQAAVPAPGQASVVLVFIETGCMTCQEKSSALCDLAAAHRDVQFVAVDSGEKSSAEAQRYARHNLAGCAVTVLLDADLAVTRGYLVAAVPTTYVVDSSGKISYSGVGAAGIDGLAAHLPAAHV